MRTATVDAEPKPIAIDPLTTALVIIDMQRDFLEPGGFGEDWAMTYRCWRRRSGRARHCWRARRLGLLVVHTREGHRPELSDAPRSRTAALLDGCRIEGGCWRRWAAESRISSGKEQQT